MKAIGSMWTSYQRKRVLRKDTSVWEQEAQGSRKTSDVV